MSDEPRPEPGAAGRPALDLFGQRAPAGGWVWYGAAAALSAVWLAGVGAVAAVVDGATAGAGRLILLAIAALVPVGIIWTAALAAQAAFAASEQVARLQAAVDAMRHAQISAGQAPRPARASTRTPAPAPAARAPAPTAPALSRQPSLGLDLPAAEQPEVAPEDFIRALDFPASPEDREGFRALRRARADRRAAGLIQASQDLLTLLSEDGLYMDDFTPDRARPEVWRRFARGERGRPVSALGGLHDQDALDRVAARLREDAIFRDTAHHFLRRFDRTFAAFEERAGDAEIAALADTRTARAFMLVGRVAGTFD